MKIYVLEFQIHDEYDDYDSHWDLGAYSNKELALNAAKEMLTRSMHNLRNNLLAEYNENLKYLEGPNFNDDVAKDVNNSVDELKTKGTTCLDYLKVERYFNGEIISLHLNELGLDEPIIDIVKSIYD